MTQSATAAAARRVTPTAVRLLPADAPRDEWLTRRRDGIGSSDVAAILGVADHNTAVHVYRDKRGELVDDAGEAAFWGTVLEEPVAREWARRNKSVIQRVGLVAHVDEPWQMATLDRQVLECPMDRSVKTHCALEVKCRSAFKANRWRSDVPDDVLAQGVWQMRVTGYDHIHVAVLLGGNEFKQTVIRRDERMERYVVREVERFRADNLIAGAEPEWDLDRAAALIEMDQLMHPARVGEIDLDGVGEVMEYGELSAKAGAAKRALERARATLARLAAGARTVTFAGELAYEFSPVTRRSVDLDALAERWPQAYADVVTEKTTHQIRLAPEFRRTGEFE
ncbi:YqaJ viral recombinase family protein [Micromonospora robiginosa]|uniref:YqaJ viral recombinase family protein n=1 Tax=Micromonospora robiginosa TaxID=2749844 RepID=A0A7L6B821_9ACTN|nr:YqaJ viral recombinase family protein [Micromonospora ferruginea]QLQ37959.1 YqaJ viral recombinase family protein [Micromonospora ferruginea]